MGIGGNTTVILNLSNTERTVVILISRKSYLLRKSPWNHSNWRMDETKSRFEYSGEEKKLLSLSGLESWTVLPTAKPLKHIFM
jgi:hypothetical protein